MKRIPKPKPTALTFEGSIAEVYRRAAEGIEARSPNTNRTPDATVRTTEINQKLVAEIFWQVFTLLFEQCLKEHAVHGPMLTPASDDDDQIPLRIPPDTTDIEAEQLKKYFYHHYQESDVSLEKVAREVKISPPTHITTILQKKFNMTFPQYLNTIRIKAAQKLLCTTDLSIIEIALNVGYNNISHFNRVFQKIGCCSPGQYRDRHAMEFKKPCSDGAASGEFPEIAAA
jgi:AraC-like DNA-binding protein